MSLPLVAIVGSPNVGKSTIFNRIVGSRRSIVHDMPGVTRDRLIVKTSWLGKEFELVDTGGVEAKDKPFQSQIRLQVEMAIDEADIVIYVVDGKVGVTADDKVVAKMLYKVKKPIILAVNKIDDGTLISNINEFYSLGLGEPFPVSGTHGIGIGDLLDQIIKNLPVKEEVVYDNAITFALIGRPNVGKSSLMNALLGNERVIVSSIAGTTRDSVDTPFCRNGKNYVAIDTAGLVKKGKIYEAVDKFSAIRAIKAVERSEMVVLIINAEEGIIEQDKHILSAAIDNKKGIIIAVNKMDLIDKNPRTIIEFEKKIRNEFPFIPYAPIVFLSAKTGLKVPSLFEKIDFVHQAYQKHVSTSPLNDIIRDAQLMNPAPDFNGGRIKIYYVNQVQSAPPTFVFFVNNPKYMHFSYSRFLENRIRESFDFSGTPIEFVLRQHV